MRGRREGYRGQGEVTKGEQGEMKGGRGKQEERLFLLLGQLKLGNEGGKRRLREMEDSSH